MTKIPETLGALTTPPPSCPKHGVQTIRLAKGQTYYCPECSPKFAAQFPNRRMRRRIARG